MPCSQHFTSLPCFLWIFKSNCMPVGIQKPSLCIRMLRSCGSPHFPFFIFFHWFGVVQHSKQGPQSPAISFFLSSYCSLCPNLTLLKVLFKKDYRMKLLFILWKNQLHWVIGLCLMIHDKYIRFREREK